MRPETYRIITFGCQMNAYDSETVAGILEARGMHPVEADDEADVLMLNTCIVRGSAENRALGRIESMRHLKQKRPDRILAVCGCLAQRDAQKLLKNYPHLDIVLGTRAIPRLPGILDDLLHGGNAVACVDECDEPYAAGSDPVRRSNLRALVTIMQGCNNWCSYCIVPAVRGPERSRPLGAILREMRELVEQGCREVTLVGQNVNAWRGVGPEDTEWHPHGEDSGKVTLDFADLLEHVNGVPGLLRIRYITSHPRDADTRHLDAVARLDKVCDHFHLPAQSGSTRILEKMRRGYSREHYLGLIRQLRERMDDATLTTDLIVGFPGETEKDFEQTLSLVEEVRYDAAFTFYYNVREGTRAAEWKDDVPLDVKKSRLATLIRLQEKISLEKNRALEGRSLPVLVEGAARRSGQEGGRGGMMGRTTGDKCVIFDGSEEDIGTIVTVRITEGAAHTLFGHREED